MHIGIKIKKRRLELGISQEDLAKRVGYTSRSTINKIENGINDITQSKIIKFAEALHTTPTDLMDWDNETTPYGDHNKNLAYFADKPELLNEYIEIIESDNLRLLFDSAKELEPEDLESVLNIVVSLKKRKK